MCLFFFFQAEDGIRYLVRSRGLGDVYKRQAYYLYKNGYTKNIIFSGSAVHTPYVEAKVMRLLACLLYTSDAADERSSVDLGGRRIIKKKKRVDSRGAEGILHTDNALSV